MLLYSIAAKGAQRHLMDRLNDFNIRNNNIPDSLFECSLKWQRGDNTSTNPKMFAEQKPKNDKPELRLYYLSGTFHGTYLQFRDSSSEASILPDPKFQISIRSTVNSTGLV
jgi:hypothetical protein